MENKGEKKLQFTIEGQDFEKLIKFRKEHENCLDKHPNMTGGHYIYSFMADGLGLMKSVTCVCGKSVCLDGDYDLGFGDGFKIPANRFQVVPEDRPTSELIRILANIKKRPGLYFGTHRSYHSLRTLMYGFELGVRTTGSEEMYWRNIDEEICKELYRMTEGKEMTDAELFGAYLEAFELVLRRDYPLYMQELGLDKTK